MYFALQKISFYRLGNILPWAQNKCTYFNNVSRKIFSTPYLSGKLINGIKNLNNLKNLCMVHNILLINCNIFFISIICKKKQNKLSINTEFAIISCKALQLSKLLLIIEFLELLDKKTNKSQLKHI